MKLEAERPIDASVDVKTLKNSMSDRPKKRLNFLQIINMSVGFFGIQFGWALQMTNMSAIFEHLGAQADEIPILWLAAPLTGLIVQPMVGHMSDNTWGPLGRRRPYFLFGAILSSTALVFMPHSSSLWMAAGGLWILDTSNNVSMEPFRAFVGDLLPAERRTQGFAMQSFFIGAGSVLAAAFPWLLNHLFNVTNTGGEHSIPPTIEISFYVGAAAFLGTVLWTVLSTEEYPPEDLEAFEQQKAEQGGFGGGVAEIWSAIREMPDTMRQLAWVQSFSWLGMYCVFLYFPPAVARNVFGATSQSSELYSEGIEWAGICIAAYNAVCLVFSFILPKLSRFTSRQITHCLCLICGGIGLISLWFIENPYLILLAMVGLGIAWSSLLAMPYAILVGSLPDERTGVYMGIFNAFIVLPEILASLGFGWVMRYWFNENRMLALVSGGVAMIIAALLVLRVQESGVKRQTPEDALDLPAATSVAEG
jgi:maltose/moltooligosaccharide transporter